MRSLSGHTVKEENFVGEKFHTLPFKTVRTNLISYSQIDQKKKKQEETIERPANQVEENLGWKLFSYFFQYTKATKLIKFPTEISSLTV